MTHNKRYRERLGSAAWPRPPNRSRRSMSAIWTTSARCVLLALAVMAVSGSLVSASEARDTYSLRDRDHWRPVPFEVFQSHLRQCPEFAGSRCRYTAVISTQEQWEALWRSVWDGSVDSAGRSSLPPLPEVPFAEKSLLVVTMGTRALYQGQTIRIEGTWESRDILLVQVVEVIDACGSPGEAHPVTTALIPHTNKPVYVDARNEIVSCR
jgi:hypothetical protein